MPPLPPVIRPGGPRYLFGTWTGRLLLVNFLVFVFLCWKSGSILMPDTQDLIAFGVKDPVRLARGDWWRLITPMFVHIGAIHFAVNSYMLHVVGYQLEKLVGGRWYLAVYLTSGVVGNVASAVFSVALSAGASGALFGLLGCGFYLERIVGNRLEQLTGRRPKRVYAATIALNLALGLLIPFIDNSAHLGGLVTGVLMTVIFVNTRPTSLHKPRKWIAVAVGAALLVVTGFGAQLATSERYLWGRLVKSADGASAAEDKLYLLTQALEIRSSDPTTRLQRAHILFFRNEANYALFDVREAILNGAPAPLVEDLAKALDEGGHKSDAWQVRRLAAHGPIP